MKKILLITSIAMASNLAMAQNLILNPGFELHSLSTGCHTNVSESFFNSSISNVFAFYTGTADGIDIGVNSTCYAGGANSGTTHIVMAGLVDYGMFETIGFELSSPIVAGQMYDLTFYAANSNPIEEESLTVGVADNTIGFGSTAVIVPLSNATAYTMYSASFYASIGGNYLTIEPSNTGQFWFGLDDFSLELSTATGTIDESASTHIQVYPNPSAGAVFLSNYCNVMLTDLTGKIILEQQNTNSFDLTDQAAGLYFLLLTDNKGQVLSQTKITKE